jgi:hypothetical protein
MLNNHNCLHIYLRFLGIVTTMVIQYAKFVKMGKETKWRSDIASLNYIEVSYRCGTYNERIELLNLKIGYLILYGIRRPVLCGDRNIMDLVIKSLGSLTV